MQRAIIVYGAGAVILANGRVAPNATLFDLDAAIQAGAKIGSTTNIGEGNLLVILENVEVTPPK